MTQPQSGILPEPNPYPIFLILRVRDPGRNVLAISKVVAESPALVEQVSQLEREVELVCAVSFGAEFWDMISLHARPAGLRPFKPLEAGGRRAPSTGGDLFFHIISKRHDLSFELAMQLRQRLGDTVEVQEEIHGFPYLDSRDLTGFIDGTENPKGEERAAVALIGDQDPEFAGGSYVFTQRYVHNLQKWTTLSRDGQEQVIGRRKEDSEELPASLKPPTAHISRVVIEEGGEELEIVRHSFPYGTVSEAGLFFVAYSKNLDIPEKMLSRMMGTSGDGLHDHLMDYTQAVSGATFFAPSLPVLRVLGT